MNIEKAVITAAGEGSRMLPLTRGIRKEMLPLCAKSRSNGLTLKPLVQIILEELYSLGVRSFCFVVRRGEHMIKDYFTLRESYLKYLKKIGRLSEDLEALRKILSDVHLEFVYQPLPKGFGDAVWRAAHFVGDDPFILHAGDGFILSGRQVYSGLIDTFSKIHASGMLLTRLVNNPSKYGVVSGRFDVVGGLRVFRVDEVVEKPSNPPSNMALVAVYVFDHTIMDALNSIRPGATGEVELTDGIMRLIKQRGGVYALELDEVKHKWLSVGTPEGYLKALDITRLSVEGSLTYANRFSGI
ncbi:MAG: sugar phosphate nucleotidyltransferase [Thermoprotei archaeon]